MVLIYGFAVFLSTSQFLGEFLSIKYGQGPVDKKKKNLRSYYEGPIKLISCFCPSKCIK